VYSLFEEVVNLKAFVLVIDLDENLSNVNKIDIDYDDNDVEKRFEIKNERNIEKNSSKFNKKNNTSLLYNTFFHLITLPNKNNVKMVESLVISSLSSLLDSFLSIDSSSSFCSSSFFNILELFLAPLTKNLVYCMFIYFYFYFYFYFLNIHFILAIT
jgi:hypothetical protein